MEVCARSPSYKRGVSGEGARSWWAEGQPAQGGSVRPSQWVRYFTVAPSGITAAFGMTALLLDGNVISYGNILTDLDPEPTVVLEPMTVPEPITVFSLWPCHRRW